ncbi:Excisionase/Xis, DNA-binding [Acidisarcina polymorpha]|uniref:Excisionase/Xis, DNA-binding n=1 Tax=Acidisarcina polymorpha TaxID=2211140 RepID=A0A2Z5G775_9BACT|nr:helix-turn-helix domain-containing protein [Acidisarcina polymorpha]AXC14858.1 Excisionase/Xis, DNA-binding [Acidisarcina polymorpha]
MRPSAVRSEVREVMDIRQASSYLGISPDSLYKYASEGFIPAFKLGNRWRFKKSRIDEWMDQQSSAQSAPTQPVAVAARQRKPVRAAR